MKLAIAQYPVDRPDWPGQAQNWVAQAAAEGAQLLVFPEYAALECAHSCGHRLPELLQECARLAPQRIDLGQKWARDYGVHILLGSGPVFCDSGICNEAQLITPAGQVGRQSKLILTPFERDWGVQPGGPLRVFSTELGCLAILICYDSEFPLLARAQAEAGAELLLVPSCTEFLSGYHRVRSGCQARALENTIHVVQSPTVGQALWSSAIDHNAGAAGVYLPPDQATFPDGVLVQGSLNSPGWVYAQVDLASLRQLRQSGEMRNYSDWQLQPGATRLPPVEVVPL